MINNNNLLKFGFKTNSTIGNIPTSKLDYGPKVSESNLMDTGDGKQESEPVEEQPTAEFPFFLHNNKVLPAIHGFPLKILNKFVDIPRLGNFNDEDWRFILCKLISTDPDLLFNVECQVHCHILDKCNW